MLRVLLAVQDLPRILWQSQILADLLDTGHTSRLTVCQRGLKGLTDVDFVHQIIPRRVVRQVIDEFPCFLSDVGLYDVCKFSSKDTTA
jgi:hypothetical protein